MVVTVILNFTRTMLCNMAGGVYEYADRCPYRATPQLEGRREDHLFTCGAHE